MKHIAALCAALLVAGCATAPRDPFASPATGPAWPAPPEPPRVSYVASIAKHQDLFAEGGMWNKVATAIGGPRDSHLVRPYAIAVDPAGGLLVSDPGAGCVHFFDWAHSRYTAIGAKLEGGLPSPVGVAIARDGTILVADSRLGRIERFGRRGQPLGPFGAALKRPAGIAVDPTSGEVYVADVLAHAIVVFDAEGRQLRTIGKNGSEAGEFNFPTHIALSGDGSLLVADSMNFRIQSFAPDGKPSASFGQPGDAQGDFAHPKGVAALGQGNFAAVEGLYDNVIFWNGAGQLLLTIGGAGSAPGEFWLPSGLAFDAGHQLLFVADSYNARVQVFRLQFDAVPTAGKAP